MNIHTFSRAPSSSGAMPSSSPSRDLASLANASVAELRALYLNGDVPRSLGVLNGDPIGRLLSVRAIDQGVIGKSLQRWTGTPSFLWAGKSFAFEHGERGRGINRVRLGGRHLLFPFQTYFGPSVIDQKPCVVLDYALPENPVAIRRIHDEVREIEPGLFLGPAMWKGEGAPTFVLWFGLDTRVQDRPIGW